MNDLLEHASPDVSDEPVTELDLAPLQFDLAPFVVF